MYAQIEKPKVNANKKVTNSVSQEKSDVKQGFEFVVNCSETLSQMKLQKKMIHQSSLDNIAQQETQRTVNKQVPIQRVIVPDTDVDVQDPVDLGTKGFQISVTKSRVVKSIGMSRKHAIDSYQQESIGYGKTFKSGDKNIIVNSITPNILQDVRHVANEIAKGIKYDSEKLEIPEKSITSPITNTTYLNQFGIHLFPTGGPNTIEILKAHWSSVIDIANFKLGGSRSTNRAQAKQRWDAIPGDIKVKIRLLFGDTADFEDYIRKPISH